MTIDRRKAAGAFAVAAALGAGLVHWAGAQDVGFGSAPARENPDAPPAAAALDRGAVGLTRCLAQLETRASILMITAHPDDEDGGLLAYESRGVGARVALMTLTRGEGGQNAVTGDMYDALGLLRTQELLAADRFYGVDQYWGSVIDYGFSKTREEALQQWGHDRVLGEVVRVVRELRPQILLSVFAGAPTDGHGNHQVAGQVAQEAFLAAGDPKRFPEQIAAGLKPWSPSKVFAHVPWAKPTAEGIYDYATDKYVPVRFFDYVHQTWIEHQPSVDVAIEEGQWDAAAGLTYLQIGRGGLACQRTQGHSGPIPPPQGFLSQYHCYGGCSTVVPHIAASFFEGVDVSLGSVGAHTAAIQPGLHDLDESVRDLVASYHPERPGDMAPKLAEGLHSTRALRALLAGADADADFELQVKERQFAEALRLALGLSLQATVAARPSFTQVVPGQQFDVVVDLANLGGDAVTVEKVASTWSEPSGPPLAGEIKKGAIASAKLAVHVPETAVPTEPYFTRPDEEQPYYDIHGTEWQGRSNVPSPLQVRALVNYHGESVALQTPVTGVQTDETGGVRAPVLVVPPVSVAIEGRAGAVPTGQKSFPVVCRVQSHGKGTGLLRLQLPGGWTASPSEIPLGPEQVGAARSVQFSVTPASLKPQSYPVKAVAELDGKSYAEGYQVVGYPGLQESLYYRPAEYHAVGVNAHVAPGLRVAYVPGTGDDVVPALRDLGVAPHVIDPAQLNGAVLADFDVIVLGVRAYAGHPELREANARLLDWVKAGGTLLVQYNTASFGSSQAPYPLNLGQNVPKVVDETAPVQILQAMNPVLRWPNQINVQDFAGWQEERGHGFVASWDPRYEAPLETHDPEQNQQKGGLLVARYGKGIYIYDAFALYRQLPAGVPGAYRILANLVSAGKNPQWR